MSDGKMEGKRRLWKGLGSKETVRERRKNYNNMKQRKKIVLKIASGKGQWTGTERNIAI